MIALKEDERKIIITMSGDKDDYLNTLKTLVFMMGNQNPHCPLTAGEVALVTHLISEMLPSVNMLETKIAC